jgi:hypothetical protein
MPLHTTNENQWMKVKINFGKIKIHWNENLEWYCMQLELNELSWNSNEEKWDVDGCKKYWKSTNDYGVEKCSTTT